MKPNKKLLFLAAFGLFLAVVAYQAFIRLPNLPQQLIQEIKPPELSIKVPILVYHYIEDVTDLRDTLRQSIATRPIFFERQLQYLKNNGYTSIGLSDLRLALMGLKTLPEKPIILTFDDGYRDFYTTAFPLLKKYQMKSINFIIVNHLGRSGNLDETMVREMLKSGLFEIGCHTLDHVYLPSEKPTEARRQIVECKRELQKRFGVEVKHLAYPGGNFNVEVAQMVKEAGFETASTTVPGIIQDLDHLYALKRLRVGNLDPIVFGKHLLGPKAE